MINLIYVMVWLEEQSSSQYNKVEIYLSLIDILVGPELHPYPSPPPLPRFCSVSALLELGWTVFDVWCHCPAVTPNAQQDIENIC